jgi:hypothetical protein
MSLLFDFIKNLPPSERGKVTAQSFKGKTEMLFRAVIAQAETGVFEREKIQKALNLSGSHFDKITSELLSKCFTILYPEGGLPLLNYLSMRVAFNKLFYKELAKQMKHLETVKDKKVKAAFYKEAINHIHYNLPIINKDAKVLGALSKNYVAAVPKQEKAEAQLWVNCRLLFNRIDNLFAASNSAILLPFKNTSCCLNTTGWCCITTWLLKILAKQRKLPLRPLKRLVNCPMKKLRLTS